MTIGMIVTLVLAGLAGSVGVLMLVGAVVQALVGPVHLPRWSRRRHQRLAIEEQPLRVNHAALIRGQ